MWFWLLNLRNKLGNSMPDLIMLAIDSTHAKGIIALARTPTAIEYLRRLYAALGNSRLHMTYIKSELNPADACTRDIPFDEKKWSDTVSMLLCLLPAATRKFTKFGRSIESSSHEKSAPARRER